METESYKIPKDRVAVVIGHDGTTRNALEKRSGARIRVDSENGEVEVDLKNPEDPLMGLKLGNIIRAIGRGFSPEHAFVLFEDDYYFELIDIRDFIGKSKNAINRMRGRLIGKDGKTRRIIEETSEAYVSIYGHSVGLIGQDLNVQFARTAVEMILNGAEHSSVYSFLEKKRSEIKMYRYGFD
ncbi:MAG: RNA-processing protein [Thermoplasmata archaeon]|nr:RNA-processing protein [Thermoplasmata archaeon]